MIRVCPVVVRAWWKVKSVLWPWTDQSMAPEQKPRMAAAERMLDTAIFNLQELLDDRRRQ